MSTYKILILVIFLAVAGGISLFLFRHSEPLSLSDMPASSFEECVERGNPVMESYPRQCRDSEGTLFVEDVSPLFPTTYINATSNDIVVNEITEEINTIASPLSISGEARGWWFFEASFPVVLVDNSGLILVETFATAQDSWMTEDLVPFTATFSFPEQVSGERGTLILMRDNPSDLPENDASLEIPVVFE